MMNFKFVEPIMPELLGTSWSIYAEGEIDPDAPSRLESLIERKGVITAYSNVYLNSPGGSLAAGMKLGKLFREKGMDTYVGKYGHDGEASFEGAICLSACALAYLGGKFRYIDDKSVFGVHRFYANDDEGVDGDLAQIASARIVEYLDEMGIASSFFIEMTKAGPKDMLVLNKDSLEKIGIVNNGIGETEWSLEAIGGEDQSTIYLRGRRDTVYGINKCLFICSPEGSMFLHIIFDPQGRQDEVKTMKAQSLLLDSQQVPFKVHLHQPPTIANGWVNATYSLNSEILDRIDDASSVGFAFQYSYESPMFLGFQGMELGSAKAKLRALRQMCQR